MTRRKLGLLLSQPGMFSPAYGVERLLRTVEPVLVPGVFLAHERDIPRVGDSAYVLDQGNTSSCVANAFVQALHMAEARAGLPFQEVSRLYPYYNARREHGGHWFDKGTYLRTCAGALRKFGAPRESFWPWSTRFTRVNRRPSWNAMRMAHPRRNGEYVAIYETGADRTRVIQLALLAGHDVAFGTRLPESFLPSVGNARVEKPSATDPIAGNHAMLIIGWQTFGGRLFFRVVNSWGRNWRDGGLCWMSAEYIEWEHTRDLHIVNGWTRLQEAV